LFWKKSADSDKAPSGAIRALGISTMPPLPNVLRTRAESSAAKTGGENPTRLSRGQNIRRPILGLLAALARTFPPSIDRFSLRCLSSKQLQENSFFSYQA